MYIMYKCINHCIALIAKCNLAFRLIEELSNLIIPVSNASCFCIAECLLELALVSAFDCLHRDIFSTELLILKVAKTRWILKTWSRPQKDGGVVPGPPAVAEREEPNCNVLR